MAIDVPAVPVSDPPAVHEPATRANDRGPLTAIHPGALWPDNRGEHIQAHGGAILKVGDAYYWFGEDRSKNQDPNKRYVSCYRSTDLMNWTFRRDVVAMDTPLEPGWWALERPKVYFNKSTGKYVMYAHIEGGAIGGYGRGEVATFISDTVDGEYKFLRHFRPLGLESRDIGQFIDDDGTAYLIFESRPTGGFYIAELSADYLDVAKIACFIKAPLEGGAMMHYGGLYYIVASYMTGWDPNPNVYATAKQVAGPWSKFHDIAPRDKRTYGSQSTMLFTVHGSEKTTVLFMGDIWKPKTQWDSRYLWMPLEVGDGQLHLPPPRPWSIDVKTGVVTFGK